MRILVTGSNGQLGNEIQELSGSYKDYTFFYTDLAELDITDNRAVQAYLEGCKPDVLINCAAYTAVDKAESEKDTAWLINATAAGILARECASKDTLMIHVSTDYVFDGRSYIPYVETDPVNPLSEYGKSKYSGEEMIKGNECNVLIIRTSWLYSSFGNNFVKTIMKYGRERGMLNVVSDQVGNPTYANDLARTILDILPVAQNIKGVETFHYSNEGVASWYDFAKAIIDISGIDCKINAINTKDYPTPAPRPFYSILDKTKIKTQFAVKIPYWRDSLKLCIQKLL